MSKLYNKQDIKNLTPAQRKAMIKALQERKNKRTINEMKTYKKGMGKHGGYA